MRKDACRDTQRHSTKLVEREPWTTSNYAVKKLSPTFLLQTSLLWFSLMLCTVTLCSVDVSAGQRWAPSSSAITVKGWSIVKKKKTDCSLSVPAWYKDWSSTIVPPLNFCGKDTGNVLHIIGHPGQSLPMWDTQNTPTALDTNDHREINYRPVH